MLVRLSALVRNPLVMKNVTSDDQVSLANEYASFLFPVTTDYSD